MTPSTASGLERWVRAIPDFPEHGVTFRDITPLLSHDFRGAVDALEQAVDWSNIDVVIGIESRGFIMAAPLADRLGIGLVPIRKAGKLPAKVISRDYELEYGSATIEMHADAVVPGQRVALVDDVLATGGTLAAAAELVESAGAIVSGHLVLVELVDLDGRARLAPVPVTAVLSY